MLAAFKSFTQSISNSIFDLMLPARLNNRLRGQFEIDEHESEDYCYECRVTHVIDEEEDTVKASLQSYTFFKRPAPWAEMNEDTKFVFFALGNGESARALFNGIRLNGRFNELGNNICFIVSDYRDANRSEGKLTDTQQLAEDLIFQVKAILGEHAEEIGLKPDRITLWGHSFGGAVALEAAAKLHREDIPIRVRVVNSCSFDEIYHVPLAALYERTPIVPLAVASSVVVSTCAVAASPSLAVSAVPSAIAASAISHEITNGMFALNAIKAWHAIPDEYKLCFYAEGDQVILPSASLYHRLEKEGDSCPNRFLVYEKNHIGQSGIPTKQDVLLDSSLSFEPFQRPIDVHNMPPERLYIVDRNNQPRSIVSVAAEFMSTNLEWVVLPEPERNGLTM